MAGSGRCTAVHLLPEPWPPRALARGGFLFGRLRHAPRPAESGDFAGESAHQTGEQTRDAGSPDARLSQSRVEVAGAANLQLYRMDVACRRGVAIEHIPARIR